MVGGWTSGEGAIMGEGWSINAENPWLGPAGLIPSNGANSHSDPRMHLAIGDMPNTSPYKAGEPKEQTPLVTSRS